jgi:hypothetical protein
MAEGGIQQGCKQHQGQHIKQIKTKRPLSSQIYRPEEGKYKGERQTDRMDKTHGKNQYQCEI